MANIFINGVKANAGGGKSILNNYLRLLKTSANPNGHRFFVLIPNRNEYLKYACDFVEIVEIHAFFKKNAVFPLLYYLVLPRLLKTLEIDIIFNFGDVIIPTRIRQIYMFDWAYAIYPECPVWQRMGLGDYAARKLKVFLIQKYIRNTRSVIGQTRTVCRRLERHYGLTNVKLVPSAVNPEVFENGEAFDFRLPREKFKLLYLSSYSPHKNFEVLIPLARKIKTRALPYVILITVAESADSRIRHFINEIKTRGLDSVILNLGYVNAENVASLYQQSDALLMPTLLESYGLPYVEAMYHRKIILTSDIDFAHDVCGEAAFYFDPLDADSILENINRAYSGPEAGKQKIAAGTENIKQLLTWEQVFEQYQQLLDLNLETPA
ncbi:MAG: glycosyltransferase [Victivallales bacterium]|nr:glycosyltransferase [Victivallales bacterium]